MSEFTFETDAESEAYCVLVAKALVKEFGISWTEALGRINISWAGQKLVGHFNMIYHETPEDTAKFMYYVPGTRWWDPKAELKSSPYP